MVDKGLSAFNTAWEGDALWIMFKCIQENLWRDFHAVYVVLLVNGKWQSNFCGVQGILLEIGWETIL